MSAGWGNALNDGSAILSSMPAWAVFMIGNKNNAAAGKYAVAKTPEGFYAGGTYRAIYDKTPNKELAYEFVKFIASPEWQLHNIEKTGNAPGNGAVYEQIKDTFKAPLTGDQNVMKYYYELVKSIPAAKADQYSEEILSKWRKIAGQGIKDNASYDTVVASFKKEVKNSFPDLKIN
jgi:multiple sugar transport system substrate-binding protein